MLLATGPGESRFLNVDKAYYESLGWFPDSKRVVFTGNDSGHSGRTWMYDLDSDKAVPLTDEGTKGSQISPDAHWFVIADPHKLSLAPIGGGAPRTVSELTNGEAVVRWSGDGHYLFLRRLEGKAIKISRVELATGRKAPWQTLKVPEPGAEFVGGVALSADGKSAAFTFQHDLANLYLVTGLK
jgi:Tol biopolymer transport system component